MSRMRTLTSKLQREPSISSLLFLDETLIFNNGLFFILDFSFFFFKMATTFILSCVRERDM